MNKDKLLEGFKKVFIPLLKQILSINVIRNPKNETLDKIVN